MTPCTSGIPSIASETRLSSARPSSVCGVGAAAILSKAVFVNGDWNRCCSATSTRADSLSSSLADASSRSLICAANGRAASAQRIHPATIRRCGPVEAKFMRSGYARPAADSRSPELQDRPQSWPATSNYFDGVRASLQNRVMGWPTRTAFLLAHFSVLALSSVVPAPRARAAEGCTLGRVAELPVTMAGTRPLITAKINDKEARFVLDSGAFYSMISAPTAAEFNLKLKRAPFGLTVQGIGGSVTPEIPTRKDFGIAGALIHNVEFLVGGSEIGGAGLIGQNFLEQWDVEYDFSKGVARLFKPEGCRKYRLAYWLTPGQSFSVTDIESLKQARMQTIGEGYVNGHRIRVTFDSGAYTSGLSLRAAARAGIKTDSPGVVEDGYGSGLARRLLTTYIATASTLNIHSR